jgi:hypothetical protein
MRASARPCRCSRVREHSSLLNFPPRPLVSSDLSRKTPCDPLRTTNLLSRGPLWLVHGRPKYREDLLFLIVGSYELRISPHKDLLAHGIVTDISADRLKRVAATLHDDIRMTGIAVVVPPLRTRSFAIRFGS